MHGQLEGRWDSSSVTLIGCRLDGQGIGSIFLAEANVKTGSGVHKVSYLMDTRASSPGIRSPGHKTSHLPPPSTNVMNP
jgi:hypothetical protein